MLIFNVFEKFSQQPTVTFLCRINRSIIVMATVLAARYKQQYEYLLQKTERKSVIKELNYYSYGLLVFPLTVIKNAPKRAPNSMLFLNEHDMIMQSESRQFQVKKRKKD
jgi:hypothetical protein